MTSPALMALAEIAAFPRGGVIVSGTPAGDRDEMIGIARSAIQSLFPNLRMGDAIERAKSGQ